MADASLRATVAAASAIAAAVSRRSGSTMMFAGGKWGTSLLIASACEAEVRTIVFSLEIRPSNRCTVVSSRDWLEKRERWCFGRDCRLKGQNRSPKPPARITAYREGSNEERLLICTSESKSVVLLTWMRAVSAGRAGRLALCAAYWFFTLFELAAALGSKVSGSRILGRSFSVRVNRIETSFRELRSKTRKLSDAIHERRLRSML